MSKSDSPIGRALNQEEKDKIQQLRNRLEAEIPENYDTDFNLYRWILSAGENAKSQAILDYAEKALRHHLDVRKYHKLDVQKVPSWDENPFFTEKILPKGCLIDGDKNNRLLWYLEYETIGLEDMLRRTKGADLHDYNIWMYEHVLQTVMQHEAKTGKMSGVHHIVDLAGLKFSHFAMQLITDGTLTYYSNFVHYDNYPNLVLLTQMVNVSKWMYFPYKLYRSVMPSDFMNKLVLHDTNGKENLGGIIEDDCFPAHLGGSNPHLRTAPARAPDEKEFYDFDTIDKSDMLHFGISARRRKMVPVKVSKAGTLLNWYFVSDGHVGFGIFWQQAKEIEVKDELCLENMQVVFPWQRQSAHWYPESGEILCQKEGVYLLVFCNKHSWISRRNVHLKIESDQNDSFVENIVYF